MSDIRVKTRFGWKDALGTDQGIPKVYATSVGEWKEAVIAITGTISAAVDLKDNFAFLQVKVPTIDSAQLELQVNDVEGGTYQDLGQDALTVAGTGAYSDTWNLGGWRFIKIKASAAQNTAAVTFRVRGITY